MTFSIDFEGTPGLAFTASISSDAVSSRGGSEQAVAGVVPVTWTAVGVAVSVRAQIAGGEGELRVTVRRGDLVRTASTCDPSASVVVVAAAPRSAYVTFRTKRRQRRAWGGR